MGNNDSRRITAEEARKTAQESNFLLELAYKEIRHAAKRNEVEISLDMTNVEPSVIRRVLDTLRNDGFKTVPIEGSECSAYTISWKGEFKF